MNYAEITIDKHLDTSRQPRQLVSGEIIPPENIVTAAEIVAEVRALQTRGMRVLLMTVDYVSSSLMATFLVLGALREFQRAGGTIVAHVPKWAVSGLVPIALAADFVIVGPDAWGFGVHSAWGPEDGESGQIGEGSRACNAWTADFLENRTWVPRAEIERCLRQTWNPATQKFEVIQIPPRQAVQFGLADDVGDAERARHVAEALAAGLPVTSRRRTILSKRPPPPLLEGFHHPAMAQATGAIAADLGTVTAGVLRSSDYAEDGSGNPTEGVKLDATGNALKIAPGNLQIGKWPFNQLVQLGASTWQDALTQRTITLPRPFAVDIAYRVVLTAQSFTGSPPIGAFVVKSISKGPNNFTVTLQAAPGTGNSVNFDWVVIHEFP